MSEGLKARPVGRILRFLMGAALLTIAIRHMADTPQSLNFAVAGIVAGLLAFYALAHVAIAKFAPTINSCLGAAIAVTPVILVFILGAAPGQLGVLLYIGASLIATAVRADGGCEVMTVPGMLLGKRTHLVCIVFSPLDWIEGKLSRAVESDRASSSS